MKSLTIHNLDDNIYNLISIDAKNNHRSLNQEIKAQLHKYYTKTKEKAESNSFVKYLGLWDNAEKEEFEKNTHELNTINGSDWE